MDTDITPLPWNWPDGPAIHEHHWRYHPIKWALILWSVVVFLALADFVLTLYGLELGFVELNPLARVAIENLGIWAMLAAKAGGIVVGYLGFRALDDGAFLVPTVLAAIWGVAVLINLGLLLG